MTPNERKALLFLAAITLLGTAARAVTSTAHPPTRAERLALTSQMAAVDSARATARERQARAGKGTRKRGGAKGRRTASGGASVPPVVPGPVDVDVADSAMLDALPGVGPSLAARIVADRAAHGTFGSLEGLQQVRGIGPKLAERLAPHVTFSGMSRPPSASGARAR